MSDDEAQELLRTQFWNELALVPAIADGVFEMLKQAGLTVVLVDSITERLPEARKSLEKGRKSR